jgi:tetracycline resistance efflux pump
MKGSWWSLIPFLTVIPLSLLTRQVLPGLIAGLLVGAYMAVPAPIGGIEAAMGYILKEVAVPDNLRLMVFLYGFGAFVGLVRVTGGVHGFARWMNRRIRSVRGAFGLTWLSSLATFMAPDFRIITMGPVMKRVFERLKVPASKVAFVIDATSTPLISLIPFGTAFVAYMVGLVADASRHHQLDGGPFQLLLASIPFNFFSILMVIYALYLSFFKGSKGEEESNQKKDEECPPHYKSPFRVSPQVAYLERACEGDAPSTDPPKLSGDSSEHEQEQDFPDPVEMVADKVTPRTENLVFPLALLLGSTFFLTWWDGRNKADSFWMALAQANAAKAMLEALFLTLAVSLVWYAIRKQPIQRILFGLLQGGNEMMGVNVLLTLVWALTAVSTDLGFLSYTKQLIGGIVSEAWLVPVLFAAGCVISYIIGSSFGAWALLMPLGFSLAAGTHVSLPLIAGAVFASGSFGGFASPLSDNTVAMATVMKLPLMKYAHQKLKAALLVGAVSAALYGLFGWWMR